MSSVQPVDPAELYGHTEQAAIELLYIKAANEVIGYHMERLEDALKSTKDILSALTALQNAKNELEVKDREVPEFDEGDYEEQASYTFGSSIKPELTDFDYSKIQDYKEDLEDALQDLLNSLPSDEQDAIQDDPNSIYTLANKVIEQIGSSEQDAEAWVMDNYDRQDGLDTSQTGLFQGALTQAITAGQSLNDTKTEEVRRFLYVFEEYNKSAGAILSKINDIIVNTARNIAKT
ncbi:MAG: hypothetical protein WC222_00130 [Parachlamydiales bacterium]|jgi:hypothetical protein